MRADTRLPPYLPYLRFLLQADLTQTAKLLYALLLDRATLSQANGWLDEGGRIYLVFPIEKIAAALDRSSMTVKTALSELEDAGLIERRRSGFSKPNRIYVKLPSDGQKSFQVTDRNPSSIEKENCPTDGKKIVPMTDRKLSPNDLSNSNLNQNHLSRESEAPATYGRYENIFLTESEYAELLRDFPVSKCKRFFFESALEFYTGKCVRSVKIVRCHRDDDRAVCILASTVGITHSVDRKTFFLRGGIHNIATRTHTEGVNTPSICKVCGHFIRCCLKQFCIFFSILAAVDVFL